MADAPTTQTSTDFTVRTTKWRFWYFLLAYPWWRSKKWVATDRGLEAHQGVFSRTERSIPWSSIDDKQLSRSFLGRITNVGTIHLETASDRTGATEIPGIGGAERFYELIRERCDAAATER